MKRAFHISTAIFLFLNNNLMAYQAPEISYGLIDYSTIQTSDDLELKSFSIDYHKNRRELVYPFPGEAETAWDYGVHFRHSTAKANTLGIKGEERTFNPYLGRKFSEHYYLKAGVGFSSLSQETQIEQSKSTNFIPYFIQGEFKTKDIYLGLNYKYESNYLALRFPKAIDQFLKQNTLNATALFTPRKLRIKVTERLTQFDDQNKSYYQDIDLKYNLSFNEHWILLGVGSDYYRFSENKTGYWTPRKFMTFGPRVELTFKILEDFLYTFAGNLNRFRDENGAYGNGHYVNTWLQYKLRHETNLRVSYEKIESMQGLSKWSSDRFSLGLNYFW